MKFLCDEERTNESKMGHLGCSIYSEMHTVDISVLDAEANHVTKLFWSAWTPHRCISIEPILDFLRHHGTHWCSKNTWCNSSDSDAIFAQITCHRKDHSINCAFTGTICDLASLTLFSCDATHEKNHALLALLVHGLVLAHLHCGVLCDVDRAQNIDLDDTLEDLCVKGSTR